MRSVFLLATCLALCCDHADRTCPINGGWPCSCDAVGSTCRDGTTCVNLAESFPESAPSASEGTLGYCAPSCTDLADGRCPETDWGLGALCWTQTFTDEIFLCILYCEDDGDCPPGQECTTGSYCHPRGD